MFRQKRILVLASVAVLLLLAILDVSIRKEELFVRFGEQFIGESAGGQQEAQDRVTATAQRQMELDRGDATAVSLSSVHGDIIVQRSPDATIRLDYTVTAFAGDADSANLRRDAVQVEGNAVEGVVTFEATANEEPVDHDHTSIDYVLSIPDGMSATVVSEEGLIQASGLQGDIEVEAYRGMVELFDMEGNVEADVFSGNLQVSNITGSLRIHNDSGVALIDNVIGDVTLESEVGRTLLHGVQGNVSGDASNGSVYVREVAGAVRLNGVVAGMQLHSIQGDIDVRSESGDVVLVLQEDGGYNLDIAATEGRIRTHVPLPIERQSEGVRKSQLSGVVGDGTWHVQVETVAADITIHTK